jgi:hypothetical protein
MQVWVEEELATSDFGDERLDKRFNILLDRLSQKPSVSIPAACRGPSEVIAAYRFFDNERVDEAEVLKPHQDATLQRISEHAVVLLVQDTTEFDVTQPQEQMEGAGPLSDELHVGFHDHAMLAVTPERVPLGVIDANIWARDWDEFRENQANKKSRSSQRRRRPIEEKESYRWLQGHRWGNEVAAQVPDTTIVVISDSEGDIFEYFLEAREDTGEKKAEWIVRACQDRSAIGNDDTGADWSKLWKEVGKSDVLGTMEVEVSKNRQQSQDDRKRKQPRSARKATLTIQAARVTLRGPVRSGGKLGNVTVNAVLVRETNPPKGEEPIEWLLLTSLSIDTWEEVCLVIDYYCCRWQIEVYFRVLKSGCRVEDLQLESAERFKPCLALYMIVAWRVMYVLMLGRECPDMPCDLVFSEDEWKAVYTVVRQEPPPMQPPRLEDMVYLIASLGGHLGRTHDGPPGPKTMWIGMQRMMDLGHAWRTFGPGARGVGKRKNCV